MRQRRWLASLVAFVSLSAAVGCGVDTTAPSSGGSRSSSGSTSSSSGTAPSSSGATSSGTASSSSGTASSSSGTASSSSGGPVLQARLTGVNWFGFETSNAAPHGLWARDYRSVLKQIKDLGFNALRLPWSGEMLTATPSGLQINAYGTDAYTGVKGLNTDLEGLTSIQVMDRILAECERIGLEVILDNHSRAHDGYMNETIWYTSKYDEASWIADWEFVAARYRNNAAVVAVDVKNEPHGNTTVGMKPPATWGYDEPGYGTTDWRKAAVKAARAILAVNPRLLVIIEGVENYRGDNTWWGGNLAGVRDFPITESEIPAANLWYSAHEYGPEVYRQTWFDAPDFPANMIDIWRKHFWFIHEEGRPLFFGEFGIQEASASDPSSTAYKWLKAFLDLMGKNSHWTFWALNPNSGDTGGLLKDDWVTVNPGKYALLKPYLAGAAPRRRRRRRALPSSGGRRRDARPAGRRRQVGAARRASSSCHRA